MEPRWNMRRVGGQLSTGYGLLGRPARPSHAFQAVLLASMLLLTACGQGGGADGPGGGGSQGPVSVGYVVVQPTSVPIEQDLAGAGFRLPDFRSPAAGFGRDPAPPVHGRRDRPAGADALPDRPQPLSGAGRPGGGQSSKAPAPAPRPRAPAPTAIGRWPRWRRCRSRIIPTRWRRRARPRRRSPRTMRRCGPRRSTCAITRVPAPISGRIGLSILTEGALVTANQTEPLATITRLDPIYVDIQQSAPDLLALRRALARGGVGADHGPGAAAAAGRQRLWLHRHGPVHRGDGQPGHRHGDASGALPQSADRSCCPACS